MPENMPKPSMLPVLNHFQYAPIFLHLSPCLATDFHRPSPCPISNASNTDLHRPSPCPISNASNTDFHRPSPCPISNAVFTCFS